MSDWLKSLPHQIPFRSASSAELLDERAARGSRMVTANDALPGHPPELMLVEAMAQFGGGLVFDASRHGFFSGLDACEVERPIVAGDRVDVHVTLEAGFGGIFRFRGTAAIDGVEVARARFYLAAQHAQT